MANAMALAMAFAIAVALTACDGRSREQRQKQRAVQSAVRKRFNRAPVVEAPTLAEPHR
jgi:hypothetical protein